MVENYDELIERARSRTRDLAPLRAELTGDEVQMSVRIPAGLRAAVAQAAARRRQSVTAFVTEILERAVREESDPFARLAAELARQTRAALAAAVDVGAYAEAAAELDAAEGDVAEG